MMRLVLFIGLLLVSIFSCRKQNIDIDFGFDYFPINIGLTRIYQVSEINHDLDFDPAHDTVQYQIKEVIGESFIDDTGEEAYKLLRYKRIDSISEWSLKDLWTIKRTNSQGIVIEENLIKLRMVFAVNNKKDWDLNTYNELMPQNSKYSKIHKGFSVNNLNFDSTCTVVHQDFSSFIDYKKSKVIYAKNVGPIYSELIDLRIDNGDSSDIKSGVELYYSLIEYKK